MTCVDTTPFESIKSGFLAGKTDFLDVLMSVDSRAAAFAVNVLRGRHGQEASLAAHRLMSTVIGFGGDFDYMQPIADHMLMMNQLPMLKTIISAGMPAVFLEAWLKEHPAAATRIEWLDLLSTSRHGPPEIDGELAAEKSFLRFAAWRLSVANSPEDSDTNREAIEFVWSLDQGHSDFACLAGESSAEGAVIREFLMTKQLQASDAAPASNPTPRMRRSRP